MNNFPTVLADSLNNFPVSPSGALLRRYLEDDGFGHSHIEVFNNWINKTSFNNIFGKSCLFPDGRCVFWENLRILPPKYTRGGKILDLTPKFAREQGVTYGSDWHVDAVMRENSDPTSRILSTIGGICIGTVPVMLKSAGCILHNKNPLELAQLGEDPKDPGGYFIVKGVEKVILLQEQLSTNKILLMKMTTKGTPIARMTVITPTRSTSLIEVALDETQTFMKLRFPSMQVRRELGLSVEEAKKEKKYKSVNVLRIYRLYGINDPETIKRIIRRFISEKVAEKGLAKLVKNFVDFENIKDDIQVMAKKMGKENKTREEKQEAVAEILKTDFFCHLDNLPGPDGELEEAVKIRIGRAKIYLFSIMIARLLEYMVGHRELDDRDSFSNKKVEGAGRMMESLLRNAWRKSLGPIAKGIKDGDIRDLNGVVDKIRHDTITEIFSSSFTSGKWGVKKTQMKENVTRTLAIESTAARISDINTLDVAVSRNTRELNLRVVQNSQWCLVDPVYSSEGKNAGLVKNLSILAKISIEQDDGDLIRLLIGGPSNKPLILTAIEGLSTWLKEYSGPTAKTVVDDLIRRRAFPPDGVMVNGKFLGWCFGEEIRDLLVAKRRNKEIAVDVSVILEPGWLNVDISPSRLVHPLLIVSEQQTLLIDDLGLRNAGNNDLLGSGAMELISSWEQETLKIAATPQEITDRLELIRNVTENYENLLAQFPTSSNQQELSLAISEAKLEVDKLKNNRAYTHCEIDPQVILGVASNLIPYIDHNQAPRNVYGTAMGKQALGIYLSNHLNRFDGTTKILAFPTRPVVETEMYDIIGLSEKATGETPLVAFMAVPYTEEDAFVFKKEFLDRGGFRIYKYITYKTTVKYSGDAFEKLNRPEARPGEKPGRYKYIQYGGPGSPLNGLPMIGAPLRQGDCVIGKVQFIPSTKSYNNESIWLRFGEEGIVEKVLVSSDNKMTTVTVKLRAMRIPEAGDKFAARNAQKGTIGIVVNEVDLPYSDSGMIPDIIVNPHCLPSRLTASYPLELLATKHGAMRGVPVNASLGVPYNLEEYRTTLREYGMHELGYEKMNSGTTGKPLEALIYAGPVFFQALLHHVKDKIQSRNTGQVKPMTRQPPKGRSNRGGLRFGEMERDAAISYGASSFLQERLMNTSDGYEPVFCIVCGAFAVNGPTKYRKCNFCGNPDKFGRCTIPYVYKLLIHLLAALGINLHPEFNTAEEYAENVLKLGGVERDDRDVETKLNEADEGLSREEQETEKEDEVNYEIFYNDE